MGFGQIYNTTWWGNALDTARTAGTEPDFFGSQMKLLTSNQPELVVNGDFATDLSGWNLSLDTPPVWDNRMIKMTSDGITFSRADQSFVTIVGKEYKFEINKLINTNSILVKIGDGIGNSNVLNQILSSINKYTFTITATSTTTYIRLEDGSGTDGGYVSNISVKEVRCDLDQIEAKKCLADWIHVTALQDLNN